MPTICKFYGLHIMMFFRKREHNPPHIHVRYGDNEALINVLDASIIHGNLPPTAYALTKEWTIMHKDELLDMWNSKIIKQIEPLK